VHRRPMLDRQRIVAVGSDRDRDRGDQRIRRADPDRDRAAPPG
jgi:hypothetical protein